MRLDAYYYGFEPTGDEQIDRILSAVACAGKAYHHTECWGDEIVYGTPNGAPELFLRGSTPIEWIQNAANDAARARNSASLQAADEKRCGVVASPPPEESS